MRSAKVALEALRHQDRGHLRVTGKVQKDRVTWPVTGIGGVLSPSSIAKFDGE
jgi:hypothetical protein